MTYQETQIIGSGNGGAGDTKSPTRRSRLETRMDVLRTLMEGARGPTQIMYRANLSWLLISEDLKNLRTLGFVDEESVGKRKKYSLTERGLSLIRSYLKVVRDVELSAARV